MSRIGHSSAAAAIRYKHVLDGQDADIARFLDGLAVSHKRPTATDDDRQSPHVKCRYPGDSLASVGRLHI
jgi:hypothetical protein